ncbi:viroplasmin family protein [Microcoleus sp. FACHB-1515]|uniref:ribonuclease H1 domain-containing protein n=1 Tax=Cyanophyceae TaxID=3028117 RepID=UPI0016861497|nr:ribonuclease H family protein [Microcoleus sp. FACHB-1515]MBD2090099.1 viroplasmin family protein [Microcoleus sp. FACHB-1515]
MPKAKYYAVMKGRQTGIFTSWSSCERQVKGFSGAIYKSFNTRAEAETALKLAEQNGGFSQSEKSQRKPAEKHLLDREFISDSICVDAACSGNPGVVEYQGVHTTTRDVIFHKLISQGTNNLGEFLAIVHALAYLQNQGEDTPIYSDSETAMLWVKNKKVRTTLPRNSSTAEIFSLVDRALDWLEKNEYSNPILKWETKIWGEIPADFGRK